MCGGIAIARDSVPDVLAEELQYQIATREGVPEIRFQYRDKVPLLPIWKDREFLIVPWGTPGDSFVILLKNGWNEVDSWCSDGAVCT